MPLYDTRCRECGAKAQIFRKIAEMDNIPSCDSCGGVADRLLSAPAIVTEFSPYVSPATGAYIDSRAKRADDLRRAGSFLYEPGVEKDVERNRVAREERDFRPIADAVDESVRALVSSGKIES